jgi:hypothetical protein
MERDEEPAAPASEAPRVEGGRIAGRVTDFDRVPLVGVRVEAARTGGGDLDLLPVLTDGEGGFALEGLAAGRYDLRFELGGVRARALAIPTGTDQLHVQLARPQGILLVAKVGAGRPPPGLLHVVLVRETKAGPVREHVGRHLKQRMLLWGLRPGRYTVTVWGGSYLPVEARGVVVREGEPAPEVEVLLAAEGGGVAGRAIDGAGEAVPGALVAWRALGRPGPWPRAERTATADGRGRFAIRGLPAGRYRVMVGTEKGPIVHHEVAVEEDRVTEAEFRLA